MKKLVIAVFLVFAMALGSLGVAATPAKAEGPEVGVEFDATFASKYVWRGIVFVDDWVAQPSVTAAVGNFSVNVWADYNLTDQNNLKNKFDEIDLTLDYTFGLGDFSIPVGLITYTFPNSTVPDTTEIYVGLGYDWIVSPSVTVYKDIVEANGLYCLGALDYSLELPAPSDMVAWGIDIGVSIGYGNEEHNSFNYGVDEAGWTDMSAYLAIPVGIGEYFSITPGVTYTALVDDDIKDALKANQDEDNTYFFVSLTASF